MNVPAQVAGEPLEQIRVAEPCAKAGQTSVPPEVWRRLSRHGFSGCPSDLDAAVFLLHGRQRQSMTGISSLFIHRAKSEQDALRGGGSPDSKGRRGSGGNGRSPRSDHFLREIPDLIQLQHKGRSSLRLRLRAHAEVGDRRGKRPTSKAPPLSVVSCSFRLMFRRAIVSRSGLEA